MNEKRIHDLSLDELAQLAKSAVDVQSQGGLLTMDPLDALTLVQMARRGAVARPRGIVGAQVAIDDLAQALSEISVASPSNRLGMPFSAMLAGPIELIGESIKHIDAILSGPDLPKGR